jgi:hypothetical protein
MTRGSLNKSSEDCALALDCKSTIIILPRMKMILVSLVVVSGFTLQLYALTCATGQKHCEYDGPDKTVEWCCPADTQCQYVVATGVASCVNGSS